MAEPARPNRYHAAVTESQMIEDARHGDERAFRAIMEQNNQRLYRLARSVIKNDAEAEEIVQETYLRAFTALPTFRGDALLSTWLTRIAINRSRDFLRRRKFLRLFTSADDEDNREGWIEPVDERPDPEREIMARQLRTAIEAAEKELSPQQQVIFRLRHYENRSLEEIATLLGLRGGTVRAHLFRSIHKIRQILEELR